MPCEQLGDIIVIESRNKSVHQLIEPSMLLVTDEGNTIVKPPKLLLVFVLVLGAMAAFGSGHFDTTPETQIAREQCENCR